VCLLHNSVELGRLREDGRARCAALISPTSRRPTQPRLNPRGWLILAHLEHAPTASNPYGHTIGDKSLPPSIDPAATTAGSRASAKSTLGEGYEYSRIVLEGKTRSTLWINANIWGISLWKNYVTLLLRR
jgi:hypothetical protein